MKKSYKTYVGEFKNGKRFGKGTISEEKDFYSNVQNCIHDTDGKMIKSKKVEKEDVFFNEDGEPNKVTSADWRKYI